MIISFTVTLVTKETSAEIEKKVMKVSEVEKVEVTPIILNDLDHDRQSRSQESQTSELKPIENQVVPSEKAINNSNQSENNESKNHSAGKATQ